MELQVILIGAIPSVVSVLILLLQILRDKKKDVAEISLTKAEVERTIADTTKTITEAAEYLVATYQKTLDEKERHYLLLQNLIKREQALNTALQTKVDDLTAEMKKYEILLAKKHENESI
jgi:hypothetical protein